MPHMFFFGFGYTASFLARKLKERGWKMSGTTRTNEKVNAMWDQGVEPYIWTGEGPMEAPLKTTEGITHILHSIPAQGTSDPVMQHHHRLLAKLAKDLSWYGYLSTTSVYGDTLGEVATETYEANPSLARAKRRFRVENSHLTLFRRHEVPMHIFRCGGIYGPYRNAFGSVMSGKAQLVHKDGHTVARIHVDDLVQTLLASIDNPNPGSIYNVVDDLPAGIGDPIRYAFDLLGMDPPTPVEFDDVADRMNDMAKSFYKEQRLIGNQKIKSELGVTLAYPTYREAYDVLVEEVKKRRGT